MPTYYSIILVLYPSQVILQLAIIATGNYNFFNLLTITLCFSLMEEDYHTGKCMFLVHD